MNLFLEIKEEIEKIVSDSYSATDLIHARGTLSWVLQMKQNAREDLQIAALAHDIERGASKSKIGGETSVKEDFSNYDAIKEEHASRSAKIIVELLEKFKVDESTIKRVEYLVLHHEIGGDEEAGILRDADSLSFLYDNFTNYLRHYGPDRAKHKIDYMYNRMSEKGKELGKKLYNELLKQLTN